MTTTQSTAPEAIPFTAAELRRISAEISARFFRLEETTRLVLLDIGPWRLHAYWNITEADLNRARAQQPDAPLVLRFTDLSPDAPTAAHHARFDVEVQGVRNNWYLDLWQDGKRYAAELGLRAADGSLLRLARSNEIEVPRADPAPELRFDQAPVQTPPPLTPAPAEPGPSATDRLMEQLYPGRFVDQAPDRKECPHSEDAGATGGLDGADHSAPAGPPNADPGLWAAEGPSGAAGAKGFPEVGANTLSSYRERGAALTPALIGTPQAPLPPAQEEIVGPAADALASAQSAAQPPPKVDAPAPREAPAPAPPAAALEEWLMGRPFSHARDGGATEVCAELCITGRVAPGVRLTLFGKPLPTTPDGGFELRRRLPMDQETAALLRRLRDAGDRGDA